MNFLQQVLRRFRQEFSWKKLFLYYIAFFLVCFARWLAVEFSHPPFEQVVFHLQFPADQFITTADDYYIISNALRVWLAALIFALLFILLDAAVAQYLSLKKSKKNHTKTHATNWQKTIFWRLEQSFLVICRFYNRFDIHLVFFTALILWVVSTRMDEFVYHRFIGKDYVSSHYIDPKTVTITQPAVKRNLVYIYLESMEMAANDPQYFGKARLAPLLDYGKNHKGIYVASVPNWMQLSASWSTMHGMISTQCGVPIKAVFQSGKFNPAKIFGNAVCLGDVLKSAGYYQVQIGGDPETYAGKDRLFLTHGFSEMIGYHAFDKMGLDKSLYSPLGVYDEVPFQYAKQALDKLMAQHQPFHLNLNSYDAHPPTHRGPACHRLGVSDDAFGSVDCIAAQVVELLDYMRIKGYLKNTDVFIQGDHLIWNHGRYPAPFNQLTKNDRYVFNMFLSTKPIPAFNQNYMTHVDVFATILEFMGFEVVGDKLALGTSLFGRETKILSQADWLKAFHLLDRDVLNSSKVYFSLF